MYVVMEIQTTEQGDVATVINSYEDRNDAENKYHSVLAAAAVSGLPAHAAVMMYNDGRQIKTEAYKHEK